MILAGADAFFSGFDLPTRGPPTGSFRNFVIDQPGISILYKYSQRKFNRQVVLELKSGRGWKISAIAVLSNIRYIRHR